MPPGQTSPKVDLGHTIVTKLYPPLGNFLHTPLLATYIYRTLQFIIFLTLSNCTRHQITL